MFIRAFHPSCSCAAYVQGAGVCSPTWTDETWKYRVFCIVICFSTRMIRSFSQVWDLFCFNTFQVTSSAQWNFSSSFGTLAGWTICGFTPMPTRKFIHWIFSSVLSLKQQSENSSTLKYVINVISPSSVSLAFYRLHSNLNYTSSWIIVQTLENNAINLTR